MKNKILPSPLDLTQPSNLAPSCPGRTTVVCYKGRVAATQVLHSGSQASAVSAMLELDQRGAWLGAKLHLGTWKSAGGATGPIAWLNHSLSQPLAQPPVSTGPAGPQCAHLGGAPLPPMGKGCAELLPFLCAYALHTCPPDSSHHDGRCYSTLRPEGGIGWARAYDVKYNRGPSNLAPYSLIIVYFSQKHAYYYYVVGILPVLSRSHPCISHLGPSGPGLRRRGRQDGGCRRGPPGLRAHTHHGRHPTRPVRLRARRVDRAQRPHSARRVALG